MNIKNNIVKKENGIYIYKEDELVCIIDKEDEYVLEYGFINKNKQTNYSTVYNKQNKRSDSIHSILYWNKYPLDFKNDRRWVLDHINGNKLDNRLSNLRYITQKENLKNIHSEVSITTEEQREYNNSYMREYSKNIDKIEKDFNSYSFNEISLIHNNLLLDEIENLEGDDLFSDSQDKFKKYYTLHNK